MTSPSSETPETPAPPETPPAPLLELREGLPPVVDTESALLETCAAVAAGTGPVAIDAERASGYRYSSRAYLIQLRREGSGTHLVDPIDLDLTPLAETLQGHEWILHAATQDLPCLNEVGLAPGELFDTELAGRLLGFPRVGLATLVEELLGMRLRKEHSAADWSTRPLPTPWLEYAALDVEVLLELRGLLKTRLEEAGKWEWAKQEFDALRSFSPAPRAEPWRRTSGSHRLRGRRAMAAVRELWLTRDEIARTTDNAPGRIVPDSALVAAAHEMPKDVRSLLATKGFHGRGARRYARDWVAAIARAAALPEDQLPTRAPRSDGPPQVRVWAERDPAAAARLSLARTEITALSEELAIPAENLLTPDSLRRLLWQPPSGRDLTERVAEVLRGYGAREWQVELMTPLLVRAIEASPSA